MRSLSFESRNRLRRSLSLESLETRSLLSSVPLAPLPVHFDVPALVAPATPGGLHNAAAVLSPLASAALRNVVGAYNGSMAVTGVHTQTVKVTISKQTAAGVITGTLTSTLNPAVKLAITGKVLPGNKIRMTLVGGGTHGGGAIAGTGTGTIAVSGRHITLNLSFKFTKPFNDTGTLILRK